MSIKNKTSYMAFICIIFLFINILFCKVKDLNFPGYQKVYYPIETNSFNNISTDKIIENIPKKRHMKIETDYNNKYLVKVQLSSTFVKHNNGIRIYSVN